MLSWVSEVSPDKGLALLNVAEWALVAYKSQQPVTNAFPMGTVLSVSDGPLGSGNGTPYVYVSELEDAIQDTDVSLFYIVQPCLKCTGS